MSRIPKINIIVADNGDTVQVAKTLIIGLSSSVAIRTVTWSHTSLLVQTGKGLRTLLASSLRVCPLSELWVHYRPV